jgi:deoxyribodipyrimidine photolyase-related protein
MSTFLIFPHQLFEETLVQKADVFYLVESDLFFRQYAFHKQKILFHRASMRAFADRLREAGKVVEYIDSRDSRSSEVALAASIAGEITLFDPNDYLLERRLRRSGKIQFLPSPNFLNTDTDLLGNRKPYYQTAFYTQQRKDRGILIDEEGKPVGGQWTYDTENRKKIPKNTFIPAPFPEAVPNAYISEAIDRV